MDDDLVKVARNLDICLGDQKEEIANVVGAGLVPAHIKQIIRINNCKHCRGRTPGRPA